MIKTNKFLNTFTSGIDADSIPTKMSNTHYFDTQNMRLISNDSSSSGALTNVKGNVLRLRFANSDQIIGYCKIRSNYDVTKDSIVFFVKNDSTNLSKIYLFEGDPYLANEEINMNTSFSAKVYGYYDDWELPSRNELYAAYDALQAVLPSLLPSEYLWSSTESNATEAIAVNFANRAPLNAQKSSTTPKTRGIRTFISSHVYTYRETGPGGGWIYSIVNNFDGTYTYKELSNFYISEISAWSNVTSSYIGTTSTILGSSTTNTTAIITQLTHTTSAALLTRQYIVSTDQYSYKSGLIYSNSGLNFNTAYPIKAEGRYESVNLRKIYWVDGLNNIRYMILDSVNMADDVSIFDINSTAELPDPVASLINGGKYTSGLVQYSYQLYRKNGAATTYSPVSNILYLTSHDGNADSRSFIGNSLNEDTGKAVEVVISGIDINYDRVRVVAIHYTEPLVNPTINIIAELEYSNPYIKLVDNGYTTYGTVPIEEFRLFGQVDYIANSIATKNNYLFLADVTEDKWIPLWLDPTDPTFYDCRAVRFKNSGSINAFLTDNTETAVTINKPTDKTLQADWNTAGWTDYIYNHDGINTFNNTANDDNSSHEYIYQSDGTTLGAEGPNITIDFEHEDLVIDEVYSAVTASWSSVPLADYDISPALSSHRSSQRREVYRLYIVFYNTKMQSSPPQWVCDLRMPSNDDVGNLLVSGGALIPRYANYIYPKVTLRNIINDSELYGWQVFRCNRDTLDRSVLASGVLSACDFKNFIGVGNDINTPFSSLTDQYCFLSVEGMAAATPGTINKKVIEVVSPEIAFNKNLKYLNGDKLRIEGRYLYEGTNLSDVSGNKLVTLTIGATYPTHANDVLNYTVSDGAIFSAGIIHGSAPTYPSIQVLGGNNILNVLRYDSGTAYHGNGAINFMAIIDSDLNLDSTNWGLIFGSYVRNVFYTQYGGHTYEARSYNSVIPYSQFKLKSSLSSICYNGDTHITMFAYLRSSMPDITYSAGIAYQQEMVYIPCESSINCFYRLDPIQKFYSPNDMNVIMQETVSQGLVLQPDTYPLELGDLYRYNPIYSRSSDVNLIQNTVFDSNNIEHSDTKIIATGKKINNEYFDSWTNLYLNNNIELDPKYGPIRNIFNFNNRLFAGQDKGIAVVAVNDRSVITDNSSLQLALGTGTVLERYDYLTTTSGFQNYFDMVLSDKSFYYFDRRNKIVYTMSDKGEVPISELNGYRSVLKANNKIYIVRLGYDPIFKEVFLHIYSDIASRTSVYSEYTTSFTGHHTFNPVLMLNLNDQFYSVSDNGNEIYLHNYGDYGSFYGTVSDSSITSIINPNGISVNIFDILESRVDVIDSDGTTYNYNKQFDHLTASNNYQTITKSLAFSGDDSVEDTSKSITRKWRTLLLPDDNTSDSFNRFVDTYIKVILSRHNTDNKKLVVHDLMTYFRPTRS